MRRLLATLLAVTLAVTAGLFVNALIMQLTPSPVYSTLTLNSQWTPGLQAEPLGPKGYPRPQNSAGPIVQDLWDKCFVEHKNVFGSGYPCSIATKPGGTQAPHLYDWSHLPGAAFKRAIALKYHCPGPDTHCVDPWYYIRACEVPAPPPTQPTVTQLNKDPSKFDKFVGFLCGAHTIGYRGRDGVDYVYMDQYLAPKTPTPAGTPGTPTRTPTWTPIPTTSPSLIPTVVPPIATRTSMPVPLTPVPATVTVHPAPTIRPTSIPTSVPTLIATPSASATPTTKPPSGSGCGGPVGVLIGTAIAAAIVQFQVNQKGMKSK